MRLLLLVLCSIVFSCNNQFNTSDKNGTSTVATGPTTKLPIDQIQLPPGFKINIYADKLPNARSMSRSPNGTLFIGTRGKGNVYAIRDNNNDYFAEEKHKLAEGLKMPNGVAFKDGDLYVAEVSKISKFVDIEKNLANPPIAKVIYDQLPDKKSHGWKYIAFGPDDKLYIPVGAPCNICDYDQKVFSTIGRMNADGSDFEVVQFGIRNTVGFAWHPTTKDLWFTENGRDWMGDDMPACELNHAPKEGMHFGFPFCHQGDTPDKEYANGRSCDEFTPPARKLGPHVAPLGMEFIPEGNFPPSYQGHILIAEHGSWNRSKAIGYRVMMVKLDENEAISYEPFATGWLQSDVSWGRPVDLEFLPDGSLLLSDDEADVIYRIHYDGK